MSWSRARVHASIAYRAQRPFAAHGEHDQWIRLEMDRQVDRFLTGLGPVDALEVSGDLHEHRPWRSYRRVEWPAFDICNPTDPMPEPADVVICEQVLEHVPDPWTAARTLHSLTRPGGHAVVSVPFLLRIHEQGYGDHWRFTPSGLRLLLEGAGFDVTEVGAWGNAASVRGNLRVWRRRYGGSMRNEPTMPVVVWAFAQRVRPSSAV